MVLKYIAFGLIGTGLMLKGAIWAYRTLNLTAYQAAKQGRRTGQVRGFGLKMTEREAMLILGLEAQYDRMAVRQAHGRLIKLHHPDQGGSVYLARKINEAKQELLKEDN